MAHNVRIAYVFAWKVSVKKDASNEAILRYNCLRKNRNENMLYILCFCSS